MTRDEFDQLRWRIISLHDALRRMEVDGHHNIVVISSLYCDCIDIVMEEQGYVRRDGNDYVCRLWANRNTEDYLPSMDSIWIKK